MNAEEAQLPLASSAQKLYTLYQVQNKIRAGFRYERAWATFDPVAAGQIIGRDWKESFTAPENSFISMPGDPEKVPVGSDLYLLAR